jgi:hypothetical protein
LGGHLGDPLVNFLNLLILHFEGLFEPTRVKVRDAFPKVVFGIARVNDVDEFDVAYSHDELQSQVLLRILIF